MASAGLYLRVGEAFSWLDVAKTAPSNRKGRGAAMVVLCPEAEEFCLYFLGCLPRVLQSSIFASVFVADVGRRRQTFLADVHPSQAFPWQT